VEYDEDVDRLDLELDEVQDTWGGTEAARSRKGMALVMKELEKKEDGGTLLARV